MCGPATGNPLTDLLGAVGTILREVARRRGAQKATSLDIRAERVAIDALRIVADDIDLAGGGSHVSNEDLIMIKDLRRELRRYELLCWQTAPAFLRAG